MNIDRSRYDAMGFRGRVERTHAESEPWWPAPTGAGKGAPNMGGTHKVHGAALGKDEVAATRVALNWPYEPFVVPDEALKPWRAAGRRGVVAAWSR